MDELMQIPDSGELEWLESCCLLPDYEEEEEFLVNKEDTEIEDGCFQAPISESPHPPDTKASGKRIWSEKESTQDWQEVSCEEGLTKRRALDKEEDGKHDEDWLRYSELLPKVVDVHEISENELPMTEAPHGGKDTLKVRH
ncbi:hypothetical protein HPP92_001458 [Vanilla planifolia]|uniref:Uncharacterized protein n=1 Tax=Vanilla planifolia TaxID=51239 RepID=A0A835S3D9_VANPL|nr:hypothetical protein HPP92_001458 [Vanilla planifolia]